MINDSAFLGAIRVTRQRSGKGFSKNWIDNQELSRRRKNKYRQRPVSYRDQQWDQNN
jgi:hypothetical protein